MGRSILWPLLGLASLAGCTSLTVAQLDPPSARPTRLPAGFVYHTPAALITPTAVVTIKDCPVDDGLLKGLEDYPSDGPRPITQASFSVTADIASEIVPDRAIVIDYRKLAGFLKTSSLTIERYPNGTLKSVNASIEDQSAEALADVAAVVGAVALLSTGAAPAVGILAATSGYMKGGQDLFNPDHSSAPASPSKPVTFAACKPETVALIAKRAVANTRLNDVTAKLDAVAAEMASLDATRVGADGKPSERLALLKTKMDALSAESDDQRRTMAALSEQLSLPLTRYRAADGSDLGDGQGHIKPSSLLSDAYIVPEDAALRQFVTKHFMTASGRLSATNVGAFDGRDCLNGDGDPSDETCSSSAAIENLLRTRVARVHARGALLEPMSDPDGRQPDPAALKTLPDGLVAASGGLIYVEPQKFRIRLQAPTIGARRSISDFQTLKTVDISVPQLGQYLSLPVSAGFGQKTALTATFGPDNSLLTASYSNPKTAGKSLSSALSSAAGTVVSTANAIDDRRVKLAKNRADILAAQASAQDSLAKLVPSVDPLAEINAEIAKANAQAALAEALIRIRNAKEALGNGQ